MRKPLALVVLLSGCTGTVMDQGPGSSDKVAPQLTITSPDRGTLLEGGEVVVRGQVADLDSGIGEVAVNGVAAQVASDGTFTATLTVPPGITVLETIARDRAGNQSRDVRALLSGTFATVDQSVGQAVAARLGPGAFGVLGDLLAGVLHQADLAGLAQELNPLVDEGGSCLGVEVDLRNITKSGVAMDLIPTTGALATNVAVSDIDVELRARYKVACIGGSSTIHIRARTTNLGGQVGLALDQGALVVSLSGVAVSFQGFSLDIGGIPGAIEDLIDGKVEREVKKALENALQDVVPGMAQSMLSELTSSEWTLSVLGQPVTVGIRPRPARGGLIALDSTIAVEGGDGAMYASTPTSPPAALMGAMDGLGVGLADDLVNQLLSSFWASGALEQAFAVGEDLPVGAFFGPDVDRIGLELLLPPTVSAAMTGDGLRLDIGDLIVSALDEDGGQGTLARFAVSTSIDFGVSVTPDGRLLLTTGEPRVWGQVLEQSPTLPIELDDEKVVAMAGLVIRQLSKKADEAFSSLPVPTIADAVVAEPTAASSEGYLLLSGRLTLPTP